MGRIVWCQLCIQIYLDQTYLMSKLLGQGSQLRRNISLWTSLDKNPRTPSDLIFFSYSLQGPGFFHMLSIL